MNIDKEYLDRLWTVNNEDIFDFYGHGTHLDPRSAVLSNFWVHPDGIKIVYAVPAKYQKAGFPNRLVGFCSELLIMAMKAMIFNDITSFNEIIASRKQSDIKNLGRGVTNFCEDVWTEALTTLNLNENITVGILKAKFEDPYARYLLLETKDWFLVEAAEGDSIWGNGMKRSHRYFFDRKRWGQNILGKYLMIVRTYYKNIPLPSIPVPANKNLTPKEKNKVLLYAEEQEIARKAAEQAAKKSSGKADGKAAGKADGKADGKANGKADGKAAGKAVGKADGKAAVKADGKAAEKTVEHAAGKAVGKAARKAAVRAAEKQAV